MGKTPTSLSADVAAAAIAAAAGEARRAHAEWQQQGDDGASEDPRSSAQAPASAPAAAKEGPPGEGWTAAAWLTTQCVADMVARVLMRPLKDLEGTPAFPGASSFPGTVELAFFRALGQDATNGKAALGALLANGEIAQSLADELWPRLCELANAGAATASELHQKFVDEGSGFDLEYAGLKTFYGGLEAVEGAPNPRVLEGMRNDHCNCEDSVLPFDTPNYRMTTTSRKEWWFVEDPVQGLKELRLDSWPAEHPDTIHGSANPRVARPPSDFSEARREKNAQLAAMGAGEIMREEFIGCRMYTGPCFVKYNNTLRGLQSSLPFFKKTFNNLCKGNKYTTTLHVINSAIVKLSKLTIATKVYRGVSGGRLPAHFRIANEYGVRGGIDPAFMSTTTDRSVALTYAASSGGPGVVFSIQQGMVDRGADIGWLSQYPHEREILFAPLTGLEIQRLSVEGTVLVPDVRLSINLNAATIEQVIGRRRKLLKDMGDNMAVEVTSGLSGTGFEESSVKMLEELLISDALAQPVMWYNDEENFQTGVAKVIDAKRSALKHEERLRWLMLQSVELVAHADAIARLLRDATPSVRAAALVALEALPTSELSRHTTAIVPALRDVSELVRRAAVETLGHVEPHALATVAPSIAQIFEHATQQSDVRRAAVESLGHLEPGKLAQYAGLVAMRLTDHDAAVRKAVVEVLGKLQPTALLPLAAPMLARLEDEDDEVRRAAVTALGRVAPSLSMKDIVDRTKHDSPGVREAAVNLLGKLEPQLLCERAQYVVERIEDGESTVRTAALGVLSVLEPQALVSHIGAVEQHLSDSNASVRQQAIETLGRLDKDELIRHLPPLVACFEDEDVTVRQKAVSSLLSRLEVEELSEHIAAIVARIEDSDDGVRRAAALWATTKLDPSVLARHASAISNGLDDPILSVRRASLEALAKVGPSELARFGGLISACLEDPILSVRVAAVGALAKLHAADLASHAEPLVRRLRDAEWAVRAASLGALANLESDELRRHMPTIIVMLEDAFEGVRLAAVDALLGGPIQGLVENAAALAQRLEHSKAPVRTAALSVMASLPSSDLGGHAPAIHRLINDGTRQVRHAALTVLSMVLDAVPHTERAAFATSIARLIEKEEDGAILSAAFYALEKADPEGTVISPADLGLMGSRKALLRGNSRRMSDATAGGSGARSFAPEAALSSLIVATEEDGAEASESLDRRLARLPSVSKSVDVRLARGPSVSESIDERLVPAPSEEKSPRIAVSLAPALQRKRTLKRLMSSLGDLSQAPIASYNAA